MDAAIVGVVGSLTGVALGAATQHYLASISRRWAVDDSERQRRRDAYARLLSSVDELHYKLVNLAPMTVAPAPKEVQEAARNEIAETHRALWMIKGELSLLASERLDSQIEALLVELTIYVGHVESGLKVVSLRDLTKIVWLRHELVKTMRDDLAQERDPWIEQFSSRRSRPSRHPTRAPVPNWSGRLSGEDTSPVARHPGLLGSIPST
jgi:hypothetical protein